MTFRPASKLGAAAQSFAGFARAILLALLVVGIAISSANAENYPARSIKIVSPFNPGGPPDALGRLVAQKLSERFGWNVVVENRPGAGTTIATRAVANAEPDGHTLLQVNATLVYAPVLYADPGYDPVKSFTPVATFATWSHLLVVPADFPANTIAELVAFANANPEKVNIAFPPGTPPQVLAQILKSTSGGSFNAVPYRQLASLRADLLTGRIQANFSAGADLIDLVRQGQLKALAYTGRDRHADLPKVPTVIEAGFPQLALDPSDWTGIVAPAGTPAVILNALNAAINEILGWSDVQANIARQGGTIKRTTPDEFAAFVAAEAKKWPPLVAAAKLKAD